MEKSNTIRFYNVAFALLIDMFLIHILDYVTVFFHVILIQEARMPEKQYKLVVAWLTLHKDELYEAWNNAVQMKQLSRIAPLS